MVKTQNQKPSKVAQIISQKSKGIAKSNKGIQAPKLDLRKVKAGELLSCHQYMIVQSIGGTVITLGTAQGHTIYIDSGVLNKDAFSATYFEQEVDCTMTELSEILESAKDTIFTVEFKKKVDEKVAAGRLAGYTFADI